MSTRRHARKTGRRLPNTIGQLVVLAVLTLGLSCQPAPIPSNPQITLVQWAWLEEEETLLLVTSVEEPEPFRTHGRIELSWFDNDDRELFRALYNTSSKANPVPPEAFGVFDLEGHSVESAGIEGQWDVSVSGFTLLTDSVSVRRDGSLFVNWGIRPPESLTGPVEIRARVLPKRMDSGQWTPLAHLEVVDGVWRLEELDSSEEAKNVPPPEPFASMIAEGEAAAAIRKLAELWDQGEDPAVIQSIRTLALNAIGKTGNFALGEESFPLADIRTVYEWMVKEPDVLRFRLPVEGDLAPERFLYLAVSVGEEHFDRPSEGGEYVLPAIDVNASLGSPDPWVVSAALFLARKQEVDLDVHDILVRWRGSKPWDETCTEQTLLYLAGQPVGNLDEIANLPPEVAGLVAPNPDSVEIQPWLFLSSGEWAPKLTLIEPGRGLVLETLDSTMDPIYERSVPLGATTIEVSATRNYYSLRYLDGLMHGESLFIEGTSGTFVRLAVAVEGGV